LSDILICTVAYYSYIDFASTVLIENWLWFWVFDGGKQILAGWRLSCLSVIDLSANHGAAHLPLRHAGRNFKEPRRLL